MSQSQKLTSQKRSQQELKNQIREFRSIMEEAGIRLNFEDEPHVLQKEQSLVVRELEKHLQNPGNMHVFLAGLKLICTKEKQFKKALAPTNLVKTDNETVLDRKIEQESLFRIFLRVENIQTEVTDILLDEITTIYSDSSEDTSWLRSLLNPFRYLPYIKEPKKLTSKLIDILEVATYPAQLEILDTIPDIIPDSQFEETTKGLCKLLNGNNELTGGIIDCLNALELDLITRNEVQDRILDRMSTGTSLKEFPILLSFLLSDTRCQTSVPVLLKIRNVLNTLMLTEVKSREKESCKILIFNKLQLCAKDGWLNVLNSSDHKPVDYLITFMLYPTKKRSIEAIYRKRVQSGAFQISTLEKMFDKCLPQQLLIDYFASITKIGASLVRYSSDNLIEEFSKTLFSSLFNHEYTESIFQKELLNTLIVLTGTSDKSTISTVLNIILSFISSKEKLKQHTIILLRLLDIMDTFEPIDVKIVFEILCSLSCTDDSLSGVKNQIYIIVRKQLSSAKKSIKYRGIISAVVLARNIAARIINEQDLFEEELPIGPIKSLSDVPGGGAREAGALLELANVSCKGDADLMGLYYDQLASMLVSNHRLDGFFLAWLYEMVTTDFRRMYVSERMPSIDGGLDMGFRYTINSSSETDVEMGINIGGLTLTKNPEILILAPYFRLLRLLHYRQQDGNLSTINALLGCSVILPKIQDVDELHSDQIKQVADCLFHCANWFRELISAFVSQKDKKLRKRVVKRLKDLLEIENDLRECIERVPEHKLPASYFDLRFDPTGSFRVESRTKPPKKKARTLEADETVSSTFPTQKNKRKTAVTKFSGGPEQKVNFRDLDTDVVLLLKYPLRTSVDDVSTQSTTLDMEQLKFLLKDLASKLATTTKNKNATLSHLNEVIPLHIITDIGHMLPNLDSHLKVVVGKLGKLLEEADGKLDAPEMFSRSSSDYKQCFGLILECLLLIFSWTGFRHPSNFEIFKNMLKSMRSTEQTQTLHSAQRLSVEFVNRLANYQERCFDLSHAVSLIKIMEALDTIVTSSNDEIKKKISDVAKKLLSKRWYDSRGLIESGRSSYLRLDVLVKAFLGVIDVEAISELVGSLENEVGKLVGKEDALPTFCAINKQNFHVFYNGICSSLLNRIKTEAEALSNNGHIVLWSNVALTMQKLMAVAKIRETKANLGCFLKKSIGILKFFLSHGIPMMELMLRSKPDEVVAIFKTMQTSTRFLHHLCCYTKFTKDSSLVAYVPQFRLTLESLVYRVKAALVANNCSTAFWMGNLKNRDLQGNEILTQSTVSIDENVRGSDEELPSDDSDTDDLLDGNNDGSVSSEVFD